MKNPLKKFLKEDLKVFEGFIKIPKSPKEDLKVFEGFTIIPKHLESDIIKHSALKMVQRASKTIRNERALKRSLQRI